MCLSRSGARIISDFNRELRMNGAIALTSCTSSISTVEYLIQQKPPGIAAAQVHLLQIIVKSARRKQFVL